MEMYIELLKKTLIDWNRIGFNEYRPVATSRPSWKLKILDSLLRKRGLCICVEYPTTKEKRIEGKDWPVYADSMIGLKRMDNIEFCVKQILKENVPGDFIETGVWRGGACIFMKGILKSYNIEDRVVWVADSFQGLPAPDTEKYVHDKGDPYHSFPELAVSIETVKANFAKYNLLDKNVRFLEGWFKDTLPHAPIRKLALLRLDGDMYESTMDALVHLYPKLSVGGYIIIDDWGSVKGCQQAVKDYREKHHIIEEIFPVDMDAVYWKKL